MSRIKEIINNPEFLQVIESSLSMHNEELTEILKKQKYITQEDKYYFDICLDVQDIVQFELITFKVCNMVDQPALGSEDE